MEEIFKYYKTTFHLKKGTKKYEVSNYGRVKVNNEIIKPSLSHSGYYMCAGEYLHKVVALLFIPNPDNKKEVDHINTVKTDNNVVNLRWVTHKENMNNTITKTHYGNSMKGIIPWNKGKTKETDSRVAAYGRKESETKQRRK